MEPNKQQSPGASLPETKISALIVDDDTVIRSIHKAMLEGLFNVETKIIKDGKEAVDLYRSGANFDIIFIDREMPIMDGAEATKQLRAMGVKSMILGVTTCADAAEREEFLAAGLNQCFEKPLSRGMVEVVLQELKKL